MNIVEVVEKAIESGKKIHRKSKPNLKIAPAEQGGLACPMYGGETDKKYWSPTRDELLADDWELCE